MAKSTFWSVIINTLEKAGRPLSPKEIWEKSLELKTRGDFVSNGKTPWDTISAYCYVDINTNGDNSTIIQTSQRPSQFLLRKLASDQKTLEILQQKSDLERTKQEKEKTKKYDEKDLHPYLAYFASLYLKCYTKTINHLKSSRKEYGEWMHPDIVGCQFSFEDLSPEVFELNKLMGNLSLRFISFELKKELNFSNLRESFFQTVSNSSWANEKYLVASEISKESDFMKELERLCTSFGIGIIELDINDPDNSHILIMSEDEEYVDWDTINKLTINKDFKEFINRVRVDLASKEIRKELYDKVYEKEELVKTIKL